MTRSATHVHVREGHRGGGGALNNNNNTAPICVTLGEHANYRIHVVDAELSTRCVDEVDLRQRAPIDPVLQRTNGLRQPSRIRWLVEVGKDPRQDSTFVYRIGNRSRDRLEVSLHTMLQVEHKLWISDQVRVPTTPTWGPREIYLSIKSVKPSLNPASNSGLGTNCRYVDCSVASRRLRTDLNRAANFVVPRGRG